MKHAEQLFQLGESSSFFCSFYNQISNGHRYPINGEKVLVALFVTRCVFLGSLNNLGYLRTYCLSFLSLEKTVGTDWLSLMTKNEKKPCLHVPCFRKIKLSVCRKLGSGLYFNISVHGSKSLLANNILSYQRKYLYFYLNK